MECLRVWYVRLLLSVWCVCFKLSSSAKYTPALWTCSRLLYIFFFLFTNSFWTTLYLLYHSFTQPLPVFFSSTNYHFPLCVLCWCLDSVLTIEPNWSSFFTGESVTLTCDMREGLEADWYYRIIKDGQDYSPYLTNKIYKLENLITGKSGEYQCFGHYKSSTELKKSTNKVSLTVLGKSSLKALIFEPCVWSSCFALCCLIYKCCWNLILCRNHPEIPAAVHIEVLHYDRKALLTNHLTQFCRPHMAWKCPEVSFKKKKQKKNTTWFCHQQGCTWPDFLSKIAFFETTCPEMSQVLIETTEFYHHKQCWLFNLLSSCKALCNLGLLSGNI